MIENKKEIIERLRSDEDYYGEFGAQFLSNSNIKVLFENPLTLRDQMEKTPPLIMGGYFHHGMLEPEKIENYTIVDASTRNTTIYKKAKEESGEDILLLKKEVEELNECMDVLRESDICNYLITGDDVEYEVPNLIELEGKIWKCKADVLNHREKLIIDLKTTSDIKKFRWSAETYNYDSQAYIYSKAFGYDFMFIVIDKTTKQLGIYDCSSEFLDRGAMKVEKAVEKYKLFYEDVDFDPKQYFIKETL